MCPLHVLSLYRSRKDCRCCAFLGSPANLVQDELIFYMRLYPPAPGILREALHDTVIDGYRVPKGATIMISPYTLHRRADYFPEPEHFEPLRFTPEREKLLPRSAYIPFSAGPRICIGNHFALMEGQLLIAAIAQRYTFSLVPGQHIEPDVVHNLALRPGGKVQAIAYKRA